MKIIKYFIIIFFTIIDGTLNANEKEFNEFFCNDIKLDNCFYGLEIDDFNIYSHKKNDKAKKYLCSFILED
mgnify:CR=1 FL=1